MSREKISSPIENELDKTHIELIEKPNDELMKKIVETYKKCFPEEWSYPDAEEFFSKLLNKEGNIGILLKDGEEIAGFALLRPHDDMVEDIEEPDPELKKDENRFYIETLQILPQYQNKGSFTKIVTTIISESKKKHIHKFSFHARVKNKLSENIQRIFGDKITQIRRMDDFYDYGGDEPCDYIEVDLSKNQSH